MAFLVAVACGCGGDPSGGVHEDRQVRVLRAESVAVLADGRVLIAGVSERKRGGEGSRSCDGELSVVRLHPNGRLDAGFGDGGRARIPAEGDDCVSAVDRLVQDPQARILVGTTVFNPGDSVLEDDSSQSGELRRLTALGRSDDTFKSELSGFRFAVAADGTIFDEYGGRYLSDGGHDPRDERTRVPVAVDLPVDVAAQPDGRKLFLGLQDRRNHRRLAVRRFDADWRPDETFGRRGIATADVAPGKRLEPVHPELQRILPAPAGAVIAFGMAFGPRHSYAFAIRFDASGRLDRGFGDGGRVEIGPAGARKEVYDVAVQPDGGLIAIGSAGSERARRWFVARYDTRGKPDRTFGRDGRARLGLVPARRDRRLNRGNRDGAIAAGPEGTIVGVASVTGLNGSALDSVAFRLRPSGAPDPDFGRRGVRLVHRLG
jgi:uncharacterized delta-60 repeat protein